MIYARQSTAIIVTVGPVLDADGVAVTGGVVADYKISKNGGAPAALNGSATYTHRHTGYGSLSLTATDVGTVGTVEITMDDTVNSCPIKEITVLEEAVYDALFAASAPGYVANAPVNVAQFGGSNGTFASGRPEVNVSHWLGTAAATPTVAGVPEIDVTHWNGTAIPAVHTAGYPIVTIKDGTGTGEIDTNAGAVVSVTTTGTATNVTTVNGLAAGVITAASIAADAFTAAKFHSDVTTEFQSGLATAANLATVAGYLDTEIAAILVIANKLDTALVLDGAVYQFTTNALELAPTGGSAPTAAEIADEVETRTIAGVTLVATVTNLTNRPAITANWLTAAGTAADFTTEIQSGLATAASIAALNNLSAAQVNAEVDTALADYDGPTNAEMVARTLLAAEYGTAATQATIAGYLDTEVAAIKAKTDQLTFSVANTLDVNIEYVNGTQVNGTGATGDEWGP
jgi:hypothetical protein